MIDKKLNGFVGLAAGTFVLSLVAGVLAAPVFFDAPSTDASHVEHAGAHASWISNAETVAQQVMEADLVVRVQAVDRAPARHLWHPMPEGVERVNGQGTFAFTDTQVELLEVYRGDAQVGDRLWIMQTGADLLTREGKLARLELAEDPLYRIGDEMVLFLVDISGDEVHAADRALYRTVNPSGRFQVEGGLVSRADARAAEKGAGLDLASLEGEIRDAITAREKFDR